MSYEISEMALNNLLYFVFGFDGGDDLNTVLNCVFEKAYSDATNQGAFNAVASEEEKKKAGDFKCEIEKLILDSIEQIDKFDTYDKWHEKLCGDIVKEYTKKGINSFKYGNAQKVVNMTMKYLYILSETSLYRDKEPFSTIQKHKNDLHIPIDSYILQALKTDEKAFDNKFMDNKKYITGSAESFYIKQKNPEDNKTENVTWSNMGVDSYNELRNRLEIGKEVLPLEWETQKWIEVAKSRKQKNEEKIT